MNQNIIYEITNSYFLKEINQMIEPKVICKFSSCQTSEQPQNALKLYTDTYICQKSFIKNNQAKSEKPSMYNYSCDYRDLQNFCTLQYFQWNPHYYYVPLIPNPLFQKMDYSIHYQNEKLQLSISTEQNHQLLPPSVNQEVLCVQNSSDDSYQENQENIKKKRKYYGTKNTEANIINQTFSFMHSSSKSRRILQKLVKGDDKKIEVFYIMMKIVKRNLKKYVNRTYLKSIFTMGQTNLTYKLLSKGLKRLEILPISEFKELFRKMVKYYFQNQMVDHILTSTRLSKNTIGQHLKRRRQIMRQLFQKSPSK